MELDAACETIMDQIAAGKFWVSTQPEMTKTIADGRARFLTDRAPPGLLPAARALLEA